MPQIRHGSPVEERRIIAPFRQLAHDRVAATDHLLRMLLLMNLVRLVVTVALPRVLTHHVLLLGCCRRQGTHHLALVILWRVIVQIGADSAGWTARGAVIVVDPRLPVAVARPRSSGALGSVGLAGLGRRRFVVLGREEDRSGFAGHCASKFVPQLCGQ